VRGVLPLRPDQTNTNGRRSCFFAASIAFRNTCVSLADGALAPGVHMLESRTALNPASADNFATCSAAPAVGCLKESSSVPTIRRWPGFVVVPAATVVPLDSVPEGPLVADDPEPPPRVKAIATPATAAAPASARRGPFHFTGGQPSGGYAWRPWRTASRPSSRPCRRSRV